jgi:hypothetical protein
MKKLGKMKFHFHFDTAAFNNGMRELKIAMKDFKIYIKGFKESMKKYKEFIKDMRHELVNDGLIKSEDDQFNMKFNAKELLINGNKVPDNCKQQVEIISFLRV